MDITIDENTKQVLLALVFMSPIILTIGGVLTAVLYDISKKSRDTEL